MPVVRVGLVSARPLFTTDPRCCPGTVWYANAAIVFGTGTGSNEASCTFFFTELTSKPVFSTTGAAVEHVFMLVLFILCSVMLAGGTYNPFIYFRF